MSDRYRVTYYQPVAVTVEATSTLHAMRKAEDKFEELHGFRPVLDLNEYNVSVINESEIERQNERYERERRRGNK